MKLIGAMTALLIGAGIVIAAPLAAEAQSPPQSPPTATGVVAVGPGQAVAAQQVEATAKVIAVESDTRMVTLKRSDGKIVVITCGDEVRNFAQIKVGDTVRTTYTMALSLELKKGAVSKGPVTEEQAMARAPQGAQPAGAVARKVTAMADVIAVDRTKHIVTVKGPLGNQVELDVEDPAQLENINKGDHVLVTYVEAIAVSVEPASAGAAAKPAPAKPATSY
jgi:hypothetical protein